MICVAGKGNIAVNALEYILSQPKQETPVVVLPSSGDKGINGFQKSLRYAANKHGVEILEDITSLYGAERLIFFSLEYDKIIRPNRFKSDAALYNIHFSLLPAYKGMFTSALPILHGKSQSGVTLHFIDRGIDTGDIIDQLAFSIPAEATSRDLYLLYMQHAFELFERNFIDLINGTTSGQPQTAYGSSYYSKSAIDYKNLKLDLNQTAFNIKNQIRAFCFREYQLPQVFEKKIYKVEILREKSTQRAGTLIQTNGEYLSISTIDYDCKLFIDYFDQAMNAVRLGQIKTLEEIISYLPDINEKDENGWSLLIVAAYHYHIDIVELLLENGANVNDTNYKGTSVLMYAKDGFISQNNKSNLKLIELLLSKGANPKHKDQEGKMLVQYFNKNEFPELCQLL